MEGDNRRIWAKQDSLILNVLLCYTATAIHEERIESHIFITIVIFIQILFYFVIILCILNGTCICYYFDSKSCLILYSS